MRYGTTFNQAGQVLPPGLHIPQNFAFLPYVPHPLQIAGAMAMFPVLGQSVAQAGAGNVENVLAQAGAAGVGR